MRTIGIDPGMKGAIVCLDGAITVTRTMPVSGNELDLPELANMLRAMMQTGANAWLEQPHLIPKFGVTAGGKLMRNLGKVEGVLACLNIPYTLVSPQRWQKVMHLGVQGDGSAKERSLVACRRLFPSLSLTPGKMRVPHDGIVDAALLAEFGRRMEKGGGA